MNYRCQHCFKPDFFSILANNNIEIEALPGVEIVVDETIESCSNCNYTLFDNDVIVYDEKEFIKAAIESLSEVFSKEICGCQMCDSSIIPFHQQHGDSLDLNIVSELVLSHDIPQDMLHAFDNGEIHCSFCKNELNLDDPYVTAGELDNWFGSEVKYIMTTFNLRYEEVHEFIVFLQRTPMLAINHRVGKIILDKITNEEIHGIEILPANSTFYRGRKRKTQERMVPFIADELWNPPVGLPQQGRYNPPGVSSLYLADSNEVVLNEIDLTDVEIADIAEFNILKELKVLNSTVTDIDIFAGAEKIGNLTFNYEYIFPNFLAQCLSYSGFNGIIYNSIKKEGGLNLCLFNFNKGIDIAITKIIDNQEISTLTTIEIEDHISRF